MMKEKKKVDFFWGTVIILLIFFAQPVVAQTFTGKVIDDTGEPVLFATIFIEETKEGCTTNDDGIFTMPLQAGHYNVRIQHVSYQTVFKEINIPLQEPFLVQMKLKSITLQEAVVKAYGEDPAYNIMRRAIAKAPYYRRQFESYHADDYSKATLFIDHVPKVVKRLVKMSTDDLSIKAGDVYTLESVSRISYEKDSVYQRIISVKSSFPKEVEGLEELDNFSMYDIYGQTGTFISPLSSQSLSAYRFRLESSTHNDYGKLIYHIRVIPKNNNPFSFNGYIDIVDSTWHVHYFDLSASTNINVVSTRFNIKQNFGEVEKNVWAPISYYLVQNVEAMGIKFRINLSASRQYVDYKLNRRNYVVLEENNVVSSPPSDMVISEKSKRLEEKIMEISQKEELTNREALKIVSLIEDKAKEDRKNNPIETQKTFELKNNYFVTIDSMAYKRDSTYWAENRKMPLLDFEKESYAQREKSDSLSSKRIQQEEGNRRSFRTRTMHFGFNDFSELISFNPVDGWKLRVGGYINKRFKDSTTLDNQLMAGYSFQSGHAIFGALSRYRYYPEKRAAITVFGGQESFDFNHSTGVQPFGNSLSSLFFKENFINLYRRSYCGLIHDIEIFNGFDTYVNFRYEWRQQLNNETDYSFFYRKSKDYRSNVPDNPYIVDGQEDAYLSDGQAAILTIGFNYTPQRYYYYDGRIKRAAYSGFPTFSMSWTKGVPNVFQSITDFDYLELGIRQNIRLRILKNFYYNLTGGWYPNAQKMHFSEFKQFQVYEFPLMFKDFYRMYHTMKTYTPATNEWLISAFTKYETPYLILKYLPGLNKTLITENLYLSYLKTPFTKDYIEAGYSLNNIWMIGHIGVFVGFENFKYANWSLKASINMPRL